MLYSGPGVLARCQWRQWDLFSGGSCFRVDEGLCKDEVNRHRHLLGDGKKRCEPQGQCFRLKWILFLTLLFCLLSLGNLMASVYTLITPKAKH